MCNATSKAKMSTVDCAECGEYFMKNTMTRHTDGTFFCSPCWKTMEAYLGGRLAENNKDLEEDLVAANQRIEELKSQVANLTNRNEQFYSFVANVLKTSRPDINTGPVDTPAEPLRRTVAVGNLKPTPSPEQCPSCGSPEICTCY